MPLGHIGGVPLEEGLVAFTPAAVATSMALRLAF